MSYAVRDEAHHEEHRRYAEECQIPEAHDPLVRLRGRISATTLHPRSPTDRAAPVTSALESPTYVRMGLPSAMSCSTTRPRDAASMDVVSGSPRSPCDPKDALAPLVTT